MNKLADALKKTIKEKETSFFKENRVNFSNSLLKNKEILKNETENENININQNQKEQKENLKEKIIQLQKVNKFLTKKNDNNLQNFKILHEDHQNFINKYEKLLKDKKSISKQNLELQKKTENHVLEILNLKKNIENLKKEKINSKEIETLKNGNKVLKEKLDLINNLNKEKTQQIKNFENYKNIDNTKSEIYFKKLMEVNILVEIMMKNKPENNKENFLNRVENNIEFLKEFKEMVKNLENTLNVMELKENNYIKDLKEMEVFIEKENIRNEDLIEVINKLEKENQELKLEIQEQIFFKKESKDHLFSLENNLFIQKNFLRNLVEDLVDNNIHDYFPGNENKLNLIFEEVVKYEKNDSDKKNFKKKIDEFGAILRVYIKKINREISDYYFFKKEYELKKNVLKEIENKIKIRDNQILENKYYKDNKHLENPILVESKNWRILFEVIAEINIEKKFIENLKKSQDQIIDNLKTLHKLYYNKREIEFDIKKKKMNTLCNMEDKDLDILLTKKGYVDKNLKENKFIYLKKVSSFNKLVQTLRKICLNKKNNLNY